MYLSLTVLGQEPASKQPCSCGHLPLANQSWSHQSSTGGTHMLTDPSRSNCPSQTGMSAVKFSSHETNQYRQAIQCHTRTMKKSRRTSRRIDGLNLVTSSTLCRMRASRKTRNSLNTRSSRSSLLTLKVEEPPSDEPEASSIGRQETRSTTNHDWK